MASKKIKIGLLSPFPLSDANAMSGTPAKIFQALEDVGFTVIDLSPHEPMFKNTCFFMRVYWLINKRLKKIRLRFISSEGDYQRMIDLAEKRSRAAQKRIDKYDLDALLSVCISSMLYSLRQDKPIFYASDTTARLINTSYDEYKSRSDGYKHACDDIEREALSKCLYFLPAAQCTKESAINNYGMPESRVKLIEFGAHITPDNALKPLLAPSKQSIELLLVASDPIRKRLEFCIEVVRLLEQKGWNAKLNYIGANHSCLEHKLVNNYGYLRLSEEKDRAIHLEIIERSHWMILPSKAEAFGIAPCEAAHFGRPSIVSDVGGLPTVIQDGVTGIVMNEDASAESYAQALIDISENTNNYEAMSSAALQRATSVLSWDVWALKVKNLIDNL